MEETGRFWFGKDQHNPLSYFKATTKVTVIRLGSFTAPIEAFIVQLVGMGSKASHRYHGI